MLEAFQAASLHAAATLVLLSNLPWIASEDWQGWRHPVPV